MKKTAYIFLLCLVVSCATYKIPDKYKNDFTTRGPLTTDVFQIIIEKNPDNGLKTQSEKRESSYINARKSIIQESVKQLFSYYYEQKKTDEASTPSEKVSLLKKKFTSLAEYAVIEQEYYLQDNSVILVLRIYKDDIANKILNY